MTPDGRSIFLSAPCYGGQAHTLFMRSLLVLRPACAERGVGYSVELGGGEALIGRGRAAAMAKFLAGQATHLLFVDADIGFPPDAVFRLLDAGRDVVGGAYPKKLQPPSGPMAFEFEPLPGARPSADGLLQVASAGTGFLMISRSAAQRVAAAHPELMARLGDMHELGIAEAAMVFDSLVEPDTDRYLSDYQAFCHRWRALGGEVWLDPTSGLSHVGAVVHEGFRTA